MGGKSCTQRVHFLSFPGQFMIHETLSLKLLKIIHDQIVAIVP